MKKADCFLFGVHICRFQLLKTGSLHLSNGLLIFRLNKIQCVFSYYLDIDYKKYIDIQLQLFSV